MNILFIGPPGSGKGTQSQLIRDRDGLVHLSTGDMFRSAITKQTQVGLMAKSFMDRGEYVPDSVVIDLIKHRLQEDDCKNGFILDGFPRTQPQAEALENLLHSLSMHLDHVFYFRVAQDNLISRLSGRRTCKNCNRIVSFDHLAEVENEPCQARPDQLCEFYQRADDHPDVVKKRIDIYEKQTAPVLEFYRSKPHFLEVDGGQPPEIVFQHLESVMRRK